MDGSTGRDDPQYHSLYTHAHFSRFLSFSHSLLLAFPTDMAYRPRNHTSNGAPTSGSAFHELVVLPTFAPHLARPYRVPGTDIVYNAEFSGQTQGILFFNRFPRQLTLHLTDPTDTQSDVPEHGIGDTEAGSQEERTAGPVAGVSTANGLSVSLGVSRSTSAWFHNTDVCF